MLLFNFPNTGCLQTDTVTIVFCKYSFKPPIVSKQKYCALSCIYLKCKYSPTVLKLVLGTKNLHRNVLKDMVMFVYYSCFRVSDRYLYVYCTLYMYTVYVQGQIILDTPSLEMFTCAINLAGVFSLRYISVLYQEIIIYPIITLMFNFLQREKYIL